MSIQDRGPASFISKFAYCLAVGSLAMFSGGCATWGSLGTTTVRNQADDIGPKREARRDQVAQDFDKRRDDAQFNAAATAWQRGDTITCEQNLQQLLGRNPKYSRARMLLADLYLFNGQSQKAIDELTRAVEADPKDAVAQHSLAEALDSVGRQQDALLHYEAATQLDPKNEVFALSFRSALGVNPTAAKQLPPFDSAIAAKNVSPAAGAQPTAQSHVPAAAVVTSPVKISAQTAIPTQFPIEPPFIPPRAAEIAASPTTPATNEKASWRLNGSVKDPSQPREFETPGTNMAQWLQAMHFETSDNPTAANTAAAIAESIQKPLDGLTPSIRSAEVRTAQDIQPSPSSNPVMPVVQVAYPRVEPVQQRALQSPLQEAVQSLAKGDTALAIDAATRGLSRTPDEAAALYRVLGTAHYRRGEYATAQTALAQALLLDKSDALTYFLMGSTLAKQNEHEAAAKYFAEAAKLDSRFAPYAAA